MHLYLTWANGPKYIIHICRDWSTHNFRASQSSWPGGVSVAKTPLVPVCGDMWRSVVVWGWNQSTWEVYSSHSQTHLDLLLANYTCIQKRMAVSAVCWLKKRKQTNKKMQNVCRLLPLKTVPHILVLIAQLVKQNSIAPFSMEGLHIHWSAESSLGHGKPCLSNNWNST